MKPNPDLLIAALRADAAAEALQLVTRADKLEEIGRRALLLAYVLGSESIGKQKDLADRLSVTEARASQMIKAFRRRLTALR